MRSVRLARLGALVAVLVLGVPAVALAGWPLAGSNSVPVLGFGATYRAADGATSTHRGLDIAGITGESVAAPLAGTVSFVGRVPGTGGGTVLAATIQTASGALTLLPLGSATVARGDELAQGDAIGSLAGDGDVSSSATHVHVGLRKGSLYMDPADVLMPPAATSAQPDPQPDEVGVVASADAGAQLSPGGAAVAAGSGVPARVGSVAGSSVSAGAYAGASAYGAAGAGAATEFHAGAAGTSMRGAGSTALHVAELAPGVTLAAAAGAPAGVKADDAGIVAETARALAAGGDVARAASSAAVDGRLGVAVSRAVRLARSGAKTMTLVGVLLLCGLGALWPLWRAGGVGEGLGKVPVSAMGDDIAAVASR